MSGDGEQILAGRLDADVGSLEPGGHLHYAVVNSGTVPILFGEAYELERLANNEWVRVNLPWGFRAIGYQVLPGGRLQMNAAIPEDVPEGRYRIRKDLRVVPRTEHSANEFTEATVEFSVARA